MRIAVLGGTGLIGSQVITILDAGGHETVSLAPQTGVDLLTGKGLADGLKGADVVVNLTNSPTFDDASPAFFQTTMDNMLAAAREEGVGHAVILSIVGAELVPKLDYYKAKVLQEDVLKAGPVPWSIVRVTQFYEFLNTAMSWVADDKTVHLPNTLIQPMASAEVARAVATAAAGAATRATHNVAGPEVFTLDELGRIALEAKGDKRTVVVDNTAGMFAAIDGDALVAKDGAEIATIRYRDWLASQSA